MKKLLFESKLYGLYNSLDIHFAYLLSKPKKNPALILAVASVSASTRFGNSCLPLKKLISKSFFKTLPLRLIERIWKKANINSIEKWISLLLSFSFIGRNSQSTPLILENERLYLNKMWNFERNISNFFNSPKTISYNYKKASEMLDFYFPKKDSIVNWQRIAAAISITSSITVISGGPGTGKTYTIAKLLAILLNIEKKRNRIILAAPTGKAAIRIMESLNLAMKDLKLSKTIKKKFPKEATTLHKLLKLHPDRSSYYNNYYQLHVDTLIIDEASMIDIQMMNHLVLSLNKKTRLILIGDHYQLSSFESGSVLSDICQFLNMGYKYLRQVELNKVTGYKLIVNNKNYKISESLCLFKKNYRFNSDSEIYKLSNLVKSGNVIETIKFLKNKKLKNISYCTIYKEKEYKIMLNHFVSYYKNLFLLINNNSDPFFIMSNFNKFRLLCALREGPFGVIGLNYYIEKILNKLSLIIKETSDNQEDYVGKPIMIVRNSSELNLYNGDVGILLNSKKINLKKAYFLYKNKIRKIKVIQLPKYETSFAMTVHKSQGSEFDTVMLILPNYPCSILTRELFYTAITRSKNNLFIYSTDEVLSFIISNKTNRYSGFYDQIIKKNQNKIKI